MFFVADCDMMIDVEKSCGDDAYGHASGVSYCFLGVVFIVQ